MTLRSAKISFLVWAAVIAPAQAQSFLTFHPPDAGFTTAQSISDTGSVTGYFSDGSMAGKIRGYVRNGRGLFEVFDVPGAVYTQPYGINANGDVVGGYATDLANPPHGFIRSRNGAILTFDVPDAAYTTPQSINAGGEVAGTFGTPPPFQVLGFVRRPTGEFVTFGLPTGSPGGVSAIARCINSSGEIAGSFPYFDGLTLSIRGFVRDTVGDLTPFDAPAATVTQPRSINPHGDTTGSFRTSNSTLSERGFIRYASGEVLVFDVPGALQTLPMGINPRGDVTGQYQLNEFSPSHGFVRNRDGSIVVFDLGGFTQVWGINARGEIAGSAGGDGFIGKP
jgi:probable HAF family extracellular repeat protein